MNDVLGIINNTKGAKNLNALIKKRSLATLPFGGRYRLVDFHLSNMVNSGVYNVGIAVSHNYRSLMGHIRSPKEWRLDLKKDGIFVLPPDNSSNEWGNLRGDLEILKGNIDYLRRSTQKYALITHPNIICNIDYRDALKYHKDSGNDITIIYKTVDTDSLYNIESFTQLKLDEDNNVMNLETNSNRVKSDKISMEMYIMEKLLLEDMIYSCIGKGEYDLLRDGIINKFYKYKMGGYEFKGEFMNIDSVESYYRNSMKLLKKEIRDDLFLSRGEIYTSVKDLAPAKYGCDASVRDSMVANGSVINGEVEGSIVFRDVKIGKNVSVKNSIIMQGTVIENGVTLENVIVDKDCVIGENNRLIGSPNYPVIVEKKSNI